MKTLDEVTKALSICGRHPNCKGCPYENVSYPTEIGNTCKDIMHYDALFYLKTIETTENLYHDAVNELSKWIDNDWKDRCLPLTWDELYTMEGEPIWVEFLNDEGNWNGEWCLVESSDNLMCEILRCQKNWWGLRKITLGKTWQAYRREKR